LQILIALSDFRRRRACERREPVNATRKWAPGVLLACGLFLLNASHASGPLDLNELRGRVIYLDFWASWCAPCRQSFPWLQAMKNAYERQGLTVIAVNLDHNRSDAERFLQRFHPDFDVRFDPQGVVAQQFKVAGMPTSVVIDRHGLQRFVHIGFRPADRAPYAEEVRQLLEER